MRSAPGRSRLIMSRQRQEEAVTHHATGQAITPAIITHLTNSFDIRIRMLAMDEPSAFRIPISLVLPSIINEDKPNKPNAEIIIAKNVE